MGIKSNATRYMSFFYPLPVLQREPSEPSEPNDCNLLILNQLTQLLRSTLGSLGSWLLKSIAQIKSTNPLGDEIVELNS